MTFDWAGKAKSTRSDGQGLERAVLVGLQKFGMTEADVNEHLDELELLADTAGAVAVRRFIQKIHSPDSRYYIRKGKVEEIRQYIEAHPEIDLVIFDEDLTAKQASNLEEYLQRKIVDRTTLILDIFARRAKTAQAKAQVELAQLQYLLPRLRGMWTHLERQRGGIGLRGPGEKEIETDRRLIRQRIAKLKERLARLDKQAQTRRKARGEFVKVALVGYTNAGKSTLMNVLSKSQVLQEDRLFATLDTTVRKVVWDAMPFLLTDTVGFIRKLPHHLIESFKSTLDEVRDADILLHVVDVSHSHFEHQMESVTKTLAELDVIHKPTIIVLNKVDRYEERYFDDYLEDEIRQSILDELVDKVRSKYRQPVVIISAIQKRNIDRLRQTLSAYIREMYLRKYPYKVQHW